ncbi:integrase [Rodentibacter pneumotropicus]|uniref:tyrosine-type recombinase/integrase n=1 Tax=Rodentibacter pneumotropicus TaxID=758 RepID=UPI000988A08E|nr:tyrosine-type recombinase/integrase [Rodentibacter pneumotropicus]OOF61083.1 integrase [Rodentibacter pneumotropicus]
MARPRKRINQGLPQGLVCRNRKRADGSIVVYYYYTLANKKEKPLGKDKHIAILEAAKINAQGFNMSNDILFIEVLARYEQEIVPLKKAKNTRNSNIQAIRKLREYFQDPPFTIDEIEPIHIREYLDWRKDVKPTANIEIGLFNHVWNMAREWGYTDKISPSTSVKKFKINYRNIYVEDYILDKIYDCSTGDMKDIMDVMYLTGQRPIDIVKIHSSHIYNGLLHITQQKTGKKVTIEIVGSLKEIIVRRITQENMFLFTNKWGRKLERRSLTDYFKNTRKAAMRKYPELAEEIAQVQLRDLRAKAATDLSLMVDDERARKQLGHSSTRMTQHYIRKEKPLKPTK